MAETKPKGTRMVSCPEPFAPLFERAEAQVEKDFSDLERNPEEAKLLINSERYLLVRSESFSLDLQMELRKTFGEAGARQLRYKIAKSIGTRDARTYQERHPEMNDPTLKLALGPVRFAYTGWAYVELLPECNPAPDPDEYLLVYHHPYSFEADAYLENGVQTDATICQMSAGYSAGWCGVSYDLELDAQEIACRARGDEHCTFVMASPGQLRAHIDEWTRRFTGGAAPSDTEQGVP